jgi:hypothetical protein
MLPESRPVVGVSDADSVVDGSTGVGAAAAPAGLSSGGRYSGPGWPQPASAPASRTEAKESASAGFT